MNERQLIETLLFIHVGLLLHINKWHVLALTHGAMSDIRVNSTSAMFLISSIVMVANFRPTYRAAAVGKRLMRLALLGGELLLTIYAAELVQLKFWQPVLKLLAVGCHFCSHLLRTWHIIYYWPSFFLLLRTEGYYFARILFASVILMYMMDVSGMLDAIIKLLDNTACRFSGFCYAMCVRRLQRHHNRQVRRTADAHIEQDEFADVSATSPVTLPAVSKSARKNRKLQSRQSRQSRREKRVNNLATATGTTAATLVQNSADDECSC